jgi:signal transduction histidine kinase
MARLFAHAARELSGAASSLLGQVESLRAENHPRDEAPASLADLERELAELGDLAGNLVDIGLREANLLPLERKRFRPRDLVEQVCEGLAPMAESRGLVVATEWKGPIPQFAFNDPAAARRVLAALVRNGLRVATRGGVRLEIELHADAADPRLQIDVIDTGPSLGESQIAGLFDLAEETRANVSTQGLGPLRGLGLARRLATLLGGSLEGSPQTGRGSRFRLSLPTGPLEEKEMAEAPRPRVFGEPARPWQAYRPRLPTIPVVGLADPLLHDPAASYTTTALMAAAF